MSFGVAEAKFRKNSIQYLVRQLPMVSRHLFQCRLIDFNWNQPKTTKKLNEVELAAYEVNIIKWLPFS